MSLALSELLIQEKNNPSTVKVFKEKISIHKKYGYIFGVLETGHADQNLLLDYIVEQFKSRSLESFKLNKKKKIDEMFEEMLQSINQNVTEFIKEKNILVDFDCFNGAIAIFVDNNLHFTYLGKINTFLIHELGKNNYKFIDILDNISGSATKPTVFKIFSNVISGPIQETDAIFFSTANILDFVSTEKIKKIIAENKSDNAINTIKKLLIKTNKDLNFGAVLLNLNNNKKISTQNTEAKEGEIKAEKEIEEEAENEIEEIEENYNDNKNENSEEYEEDKQNNDFEENKDNENAKEEIKDDFEEENDNNASDKNTYINKDEDTNNLDIDDINAELEKNNNEFGENLKKYNKLKNKSFIFKKIGQIVIVIAIIAAIIFIRNLKNKKQQFELEKEEIAYQESVQLIERGLTNINAKLIIDDKDSALQISKEVETLISQLPKNKVEKINELNKELDTYLNEIRNITQIDEPTIIAELANQASKMILSNGSIYLYNDSNSLYKINLEDNEIKTIATNIDDKGAWQKNAPDFEENKTLLLYNGSGLSQYDFETNELENIDIELASNISITDLNFYGQKLYLIDAQNSKIYKHTKLTKNSFNSGTKWLEDKTDLKNSVSISIDGNIWVLKNNGEIIKLFKGQKEDFKIKTIDPTLNSPTKIYTTLEMNNVYILEPSAKRLVVIDKLGNLISQYYSEKFDNLLDFVVDKKADGSESGKIYLLNGMKVFEISS